MAFFSRPNLDNEQFKQLSGTTLTLSGTTQIAQQGGLQLPDGNNGYIPVVTCGAVNQTVLTYIESGGTCCLTLLPPSSGSSTGKYTCDSPTTCSVGGIPAGTPIYNCGIDEILEMILVPTLIPTKVEPSATFSLSCFPSAPTGYYEIGTSISITGSSTFSQGSVNPVYGSGPSVRSGLPYAYCYTTSFGGACPPISSSGLSNLFAFTIHNIAGNETYTNKVYYSSGETILNSAGSGATFTTTCTCNPLPSGSTSNINRSIFAVHPYFYGKLTGSTRPTPDATLVANGTKIICPSTSTVTVDFNSAGNEYTWLAIPQISTSKTCWYINALDNGRINNSPTDKYPDEQIVSGVSYGVGSTTYKVYMSKAIGEITEPIQFRNS